MELDNKSQSFCFMLQTVDQFFSFKVPMRSGELSSLFRGIDNAFQVYARNVVNQLGTLKHIALNVVFHENG